ncbi:MAG: hypothetical protein LBC37_02160 [Zoogloeaceae bacterium]|jgi:hypothetical protein|nr:hypothetical protein [Zoogloeaceae bacterium]
MRTTTAGTRPRAVATEAVATKAAAAEAVAIASGRWRVCRAGFLSFLLLGAALFLFACSRAEPQAALEASVRKLQTALEEKSVRDVLSLLADDFAAPAPEDGREWARRTMLMMFSRYQNIRIMVLSSESRIDAQVSDRATTTAKVALIGAEGLIPDNARQFQVRMGWIRNGEDWKLTRLEWE